MTGARPISPPRSPYITREGWDALNREQDALWKRRREVVRHLTAAAAEGDRSENAEYIYRKKQLAEIAERIVASGEKVEGYLDIKLSVSESRFTNWPPALQQQFAAARTVDSGKPSFTLSLDSE